MLAPMRRIILALAVIAAPAAADLATDLADAVLSRTPVIDGHNDTPNQIKNLFGNGIGFV
jgi:membrane dipeptidase